MIALHSGLGLLGLLLVAWLLSENRWQVPLQVVIGGVALQIALALLFIKFPPATAVFLLLNEGVAALQTATDAGTALVFGYLGSGRPPFDETHPESSFILAFRAFPLVLVISAIASLLLYWGVLQRIVAALAFALRRTLGVGGALALGGAVHIFVGMVEAPLLVRPYLNRMSRGELFALMSCGMAGIAGTMMVIYAAILGPVIPDALGNILIASIISTPAALAVAALMVPFTPDPEETAALTVDDPPASSMEAIVRGTIDGIGIVATIIAMLIVLIALVTLVNLALGQIPTGGWAGGEPITLQRIFSYAFWPLLWMIGIPVQELGTASLLMSTKTVLNEFVAYLDLAKLAPGVLSERSRLMMTYALCGFANFGSLGILVGGMTAMAPERKHDIISLGPRSIVSGTLATMMSAAVVGMIT
jgi:concentrative nucleoside transporter, CNT family